MTQAKITQASGHNYTSTSTSLKYRTKNSGNPLSHDTVDANFEILRGAVNGLVDDVATRLGAGDLSSYITSTSLATTLTGYLTSVPSTYKTKTENDALYQPVGSYLTAHQSLANYKTKTENDALYQPAGNYLTAHQDISAYRTKAQNDALYQPVGSYQPAGNYLTAHQSLANYYTKTDIDYTLGGRNAQGQIVSGAGYVQYSGLTSVLFGYYTEAEADAAIAAAIAAGGGGGAAFSFNSSTSTLTLTSGGTGSATISVSNAVLTITQT